MKIRIRVLLVALTVAGISVPLAYGAGDDDPSGMPAPASAVDPASQPFNVAPAAGAFGFPDAGAAMPGMAPAMAAPPVSPDPAAAGAVPTPPPLVNLGVAADPLPGTTQVLATAQGPIESYQFLFREDPELGVVREKMLEGEAQQRREAEIQRFIPKYLGAAGAQPQGAPQGYDPRAGAEWDFYFEQLQLYSQYVREQVLEGEQDLPVPTFAAPDMNTVATERATLRGNYERAAITQVNRQLNENLDFYDRLQTREDRRRRFYEWLASQQRALDDWAMVWARRVGGQNWAGQPVRLDDWYYGVNFAARTPALVQIDGRRYLLSEEPQRRVPVEQLNVLSTNLTPYDILDETGTLKTPELERLRGTAVRAPVDETAAPAADGVIELEH